MKKKAVKKGKPSHRNALIAIIIAALILLVLGFGLLYKHVAKNTSTISDEHTTTVAKGVLNHQDVDATVFWVGEPPDSDNHDITNVSSAWVDNWVQEFGGVDNPDNRCQWRPCAFVPKENAFYFALPFNDLDNNGNPKSASILSQIPWYPGQPAANGQSLVKNHWIAVTKDGKTAYAQWEDVGPFNEDDQAYVFGTKPSKAHAGLDLSPATDDYIGGTGDDQVSWRFVDADKVPAGPWTTSVTTSGVSF
jgi:hypothetical protein